MIPSLQLPPELWDLVEDGLWPLDSHAWHVQNSHPLIRGDVVRTFAPKEKAIVFYPYPFCTVEEDRKNNRYWEDERSAIWEIDPKLSLLIGDFGVGSDTAIILDYRTEEPRLLRLQWGRTENHWVDCGLTIGELAVLIRRHSGKS